MNTPRPEWPFRNLTDAEVRRLQRRARWLAVCLVAALVALVLALWLR